MQRCSPFSFLRAFLSRSFRLMGVLLVDDLPPTCRTFLTDVFIFPLLIKCGVLGKLSFRAVAMIPIRVAQPELTTWVASIRPTEVDPIVWGYSHRAQSPGVITYASL